MKILFLIFLICKHYNLKFANQLHTWCNEKSVLEVGIEMEVL